MAGSGLRGRCWPVLAATATAATTATSATSATAPLELGAAEAIIVAGPDRVADRYGRDAKRERPRRFDRRRTVRQIAGHCRIRSGSGPPCQMIRSYGPPISQPPLPRASSAATAMSSSDLGSLWSSLSSLAGLLRFAGFQLDRQKAFQISGNTCQEQEKRERRESSSSAAQARHSPRASAAIAAIARWA